MKLIVRISVSALILSAAVVGNSFNKTSTNSTTLVAGVPGGGPIPMCNPFTEKCPNIR